MDDSLLMILGIAAGVALLYAGSVIRSRTRNRPRSRGRDDGAGDA